MAVVRRAIHLERKLRIQYKDAKGKETDRVIWPFLQVYFDGGLLISAWCETRGSIRHFHTNRMVSLSELSTRYPKRRHDLIKLWREMNAAGRSSPMTTATF
jgi:predicted DNA-binding transcriptional regulator YafY